MAKAKKVAASKPTKRKMSDVLEAHAEERQACGLTLNDAQLEFIAKVVKAAQ